MIILVSPDLGIIGFFTSWALAEAFAGLQDDSADLLFQVLAA